ncbi:CBL-interacting protein kinase 2 [Linum perenne]
MNKYELGKLLGKGNFAKVYHARNIQTGQNVAIKVIDKSKIPAGMTSDQIKREISVMRLVRHPNVVLLFEVMGYDVLVRWVRCLISVSTNFGRGRV